MKIFVILYRNLLYLYLVGIRGSDKFENEVFATISGKNC